MCPLIARRGEHAWFSIGASGGRKIMPAVMQISSFLIITAIAALGMKTSLLALARIGHRPRGHGILGVILREGQSLRLRA